MATPTSVANGSGSGAATTSGTITSVSVSVGDVVVVRIAETDGNQRTVTVTDDLGNTWTPRQSAANSRKAFIITSNITVAGTMTVTTTWNLSATWVSRVDVIRDADGGTAYDTSDQFTQTASSCFAAPSTAIDTAANVIVLAAYSCSTTRTWTPGGSYSTDASGGGYVFQSLSSAGALTDERAPATQSSTALASAACVVSIGGSAGATAGAILIGGKLEGRGILGGRLAL